MHDAKATLIRIITQTVLSMHCFMHHFPTGLRFIVIGIALQMYVLSSNIYEQRTMNWAEQNSGHWQLMSPMFDIEQNSNKFVHAERETSWKNPAAHFPKITRPLDQ